MTTFAQVAGPSGQMTWIRDGPKCLDASNIIEAIDNRLIVLFLNSQTFLFGLEARISSYVMNNCYIV